MPPPPLGGNSIKGFEKKIKRGREEGKREGRGREVKEGKGKAKGEKSEREKAS